jgi:hypothetical protein
VIVVAKSAEADLCVAWGGLVVGLNMMDWLSDNFGNVVDWSDNFSDMVDWLDHLGNMMLDGLWDLVVGWLTVDDSVESMAII